MPIITPHSVYTFKQHETTKTENSAHIYQAKTETKSYLNHSASLIFDQDSLNHNQTP